MRTDYVSLIFINYVFRICGFFLVWVIRILKGFEVLSTNQYLIAATSKDINQYMFLSVVDFDSLNLIAWVIISMIFLIFLHSDPYLCPNLI